MYFLKFLLSVIFISTLLISPSLAQQQDAGTKISLSSESGFYVQSADDFMGFRISTRLQQQAGLYASLDHQNAVETDFLIRRARLRVHGFFYEKKLAYFVQIQMDKGQVLLSNAEFCWKPTDRLTLNFGQLWPVGARQFRTASGSLQMIDRSSVTRFFTPGYDLGVSSRYDISLASNFMLKSYASITHGEGMNVATASGGFAYAGRVELLPLGNFTKHRDYSESDVFGEPSPKLSFGASLHYNQDANLLLGGATQAASWQNQPNDISTYSVDALYKHQGFSLLAEFIHRELQQNKIPNSSRQIYHLNP